MGANDFYEDWSKKQKDHLTMVTLTDGESVEVVRKGYNCIYIQRLGESIPVWRVPVSEYQHFELPTLAEYRNTLQAHLTKLGLERFRDSGRELKDLKGVPLKIPRWLVVKIGDDLGVTLEEVNRVTG